MSKAKPVQKRKLWSQESMTRAMESMVKDGKGLREVARSHGVPVETLRRRFIGSVEMDCKPGPATIFTKEEEDKFCEYLVLMADIGYGLTREMVMHLAYMLAERLQKKHNFKEDKAGRSWFDGFMKRHPQLTRRTPQPLSYCRALCSNPNILSSFFGKLGEVYGKLNILTKPMLVFNCDETGVSIVHKPGKVIAQLGRRNIHSITSAERGKTHTILSCVSATGYALPPTMVYPRKRAVPDKLKGDAFPNTLFCNSESGWVNADVFLGWLDFFIDNIPPTRPVLLIQDGHTSHVSIDLIEKARANDIHLLCLPAHTTHILQPLDVGVFKSFKSHFSKACTKFLAQHPGQVITTDILASLVAIAWPQSHTILNIMSGFKKTGIYPFNPSAVEDRQTDPSRAFRVDDEHPPVSDSEQLDSPLFTVEQETLFAKRFEEGYDLKDPTYVAWLKLNHPEVAVSVTGSDKSSEFSSQHTASVSVSSSEVLSEVLVLPASKAPKRKRKAALNRNAVCITDTEVLKEMKAKEAEKLEAEQEKAKRKLEKEKKKQERELNRATKKEQRMKEKEEKARDKEQRRIESEQKRRDKQQGKAGTSRRKTKRTYEVDLLTSDDDESTDLIQKMLDVHFDESEAEDTLCPKCGMIYGDDSNELWICCDGCNVWFNIQCTNVSEKRIPETFFCEQCDC